MKTYSYFPGCSAEASGRGLDISTHAVAGLLDLDLRELKDWTCCGSTPYGSLNAEEGVLVSARNLAIAEKGGLDLVTPCSNCMVTLSNASRHLKRHPRLMKDVNAALAVDSLEYRGTVQVRHLVEVFINDVTPETIAAKAKRSLNRLKIAPYYGCQLTRPECDFDHPECPQSLEIIITALGGEPVPYPLKSRCCGGSAVIADETVLDLVRQLLDCAAQNGATCIVTPCPLCQTNLDAYQGLVNDRYRTRYNLPVFFVSQLIGLGLGMTPGALGLDTNIVSPTGVLREIFQSGREVKI